MKILFVVVVVILLASTLCFAEESKNRYELFDGTISTLVVGDKAVHNRGTFLLDTYTGEAYIYYPQSGGWIKTEKVSKPSK